MMLKAATKGKPMTINSYSLGKFINLDSLIKDETISLENGAIVVKDTEKLAKIIDGYNKTIDDQRRERLTVNDREEIDI